MTYEKAGQKELAIDYLLRAIAAKPTHTAAARFNRELLRKFKSADAK